MSTPPPVPPRRIVPPAMPAPSSTSRSPDAHTPPRHDRAPGAGALRLVALVLLVAAAVAGGMVAWRAWRTPREQAVVKAIEEDTTAQLAADRQVAEAEALRDGWVGVAQTKQGAVITLATLDPESRFARQFMARTSQPVGLATISVDNSAGSGEVIVNPSGAMLHLRSGTRVPALEPMEVLAGVTTDRAAAQRDLSPPYRCAAGKRLEGKLLLMPPGIDPKELLSITLHVNMQPQEIPGEFMDEAEKAKMMQSGRLRAGGP